MRGRLATLVAWALLGPGAASADPAYLPPFLDRVPAVGDRWVYDAESSLRVEFGLYVVEVVEAAEDPDGWRYVVEHHLEFPPWAATVPSLARTEWFLRADGSIWRGDGWVGGERSIDLRKPLAVIRKLPSVLERTRFGYLGGAKPRRGSISGVPTGRFDSVTGLPESGVYLVRVAHSPPGSVGARYEDGDAKRLRPTMTVRYDELLGRVGWAWADHQVRWGLASARIDGETYEP